MNRFLRLVIALVAGGVLCTSGCAPETADSNGLESPTITGTESDGSSPPNLVSAYSDKAYEAGIEIRSRFTQLPVFEGQPRFLGIRFGPFGSTLLPAAIDDTHVYIDLDLDGSITETESFPLETTSELEGTRYSSATVKSVAVDVDQHESLTFEIARRDDSVSANLKIKLWGWDPLTTGADLVPLKLSTSKRSPVVHFDGPLAMGMYRETESLTRGKVADFYTLVGSPGSGVGTFAAIENTEIPADAHPRASFEFPHQAPGKPPIVVDTILKTRC